MSMKEIENELDVNRRTIRSALETGKLRFYRFERQIRIKYEDLLAFMDDCAKNFNPRLLQRLYTNDGSAAPKTGDATPADELNQKEESHGDTGE